MISALQEEFEVELDFEEVDPEDLSIIGLLCKYIANKQEQITTDD